MSIIQADTWENGAGDSEDLADVSQGRAKMWVHYSASTGVADSLNVGSLTDNGTGDFSINFTNNMDNDQYASVGQTIADSTNDFFCQCRSVAVSATRHITYFSDAATDKTAQDVTNQFVVLHGTLA